MCPMNIRNVFITIFSVCALVVGAQTVDFDAKMRQYGLVDVTTISHGITVNLKYATTDNFVHRNMYGSFKRGYLHVSAAKALRVALNQLRRIDPNYNFIIYDAARPLSVQHIMFDAVAGTPNEKYVAKPTNGGPHNYGIAIDIALTYRGRPVDMGTPFDTFSTDAHITDEATLVAQGRISKQAMRNRRLLRWVLVSNGFGTYSREWWHFTRYDMKYTRAHTRLLDF